MLFLHGRITQALHFNVLSSFVLWIAGFKKGGCLFGQSVSKLYMYCKHTVHVSAAATQRAFYRFTYPDIGETCHTQGANQHCYCTKNFYTTLNRARSKQTYRPVDKYRPSSEAGLRQKPWFPNLSPSYRDDPGSTSCRIKQ